MSRPDRVICTPSLEQISVFPEAAGAPFTVLLQWNEPPVQRDWEVAVWHSSKHTGEWNASHLRFETAGTKPVIDSQRPNHMSPS